MATKEDLVALESSMDTKIDGLEGRLSKDITDLGQSIQALASHMDERFDELMPFKRDVESHEKRIKYLEDKVLKAA